MPCPMIPRMWTTGEYTLSDGDNLMEQCANILNESWSMPLPFDPWRVLRCTMVWLSARSAGSGSSTSRRTQYWGQSFRTMGYALSPVQLTGFYPCAKTCVVGMENWRNMNYLPTKTWQARFHPLSSPPCELLWNIHYRTLHDRMLYLHKDK